MHQPRSFQTLSSPAKTRKTQNDGEAAENMWSGLLDSVGSGKRLPEKTVLLLGNYVYFLKWCSSLTLLKGGPQNSRRNFWRPLHQIPSGNSKIGTERSHPSPMNLLLVILTRMSLMLIKRVRSLSGQRDSRC